MEAIVSKEASRQFTLEFCDYVVGTGVAEGATGVEVGGAVVGVLGIGVGVTGAEVGAGVLVGGGE